MILSCPDDACGGNADGWGGRDGAAALTVGLIFCRLFDQAKSRKKCRLDLLVPFPSWEKERMDAVFDSSDCRDAAASVGGVFSWCNLSNAAHALAVVLLVRVGHYVTSNEKSKVFLRCKLQPIGMFCSDNEEILF